MFAGNSEPEPHKSLTLQLAPSGDDVAIRQTFNPMKITSFSSWMEAWNVYLSIRIDHADLWLQCMTARSMHSTHWPCAHCGATNHYPDHCPFRPNPSLAITGGQRVTTRGHPSSRPNVTTHSSQSKPVTCRDFNCSFCHRPECKYSHYCEYCGANHPVRNCSSQGWPQPTH